MLATLENIADLAGENNRFVQGDICDRALVERILKDEKPWAIVNFAAESHVDRSILDASPFLRTNIAGVQTLLEAIRNHTRWSAFCTSPRTKFTVTKRGQEFSSEGSPLLPSSPYAATKAAADLLCFSYRRTYGLPIMVTRSSNNYGPIPIS